MASFPLVTLAANNFYPGSYIAVNLGGNSGSGGSAPVNALLLGNALASSPCVVNGFVDGYVFGPDVVGYTVSTVTDVINQFGARSELHLGFLEFAKTNPTLPVYLLAVKESTGNAASLVTTFTGTALAYGSVRTFVGDGFVDSPISPGDTPTVIALNAANALNAVNTFPATALSSVGVLTHTAANKGPRGNDIRAAVQVNGVGVGVTSTNQNFTYFSGGTVEDSTANALVTIDAFKFRYIAAAMEDATSSGNLGLLSAQVTSQALPIPGLRQRLVSCAVGSVAVANAFAKNLNTPRTGVAWQQNSNKTRMQLAAQVAAGLSLGENQSVPVLNYDFAGATGPTQPYFKCSNPFDGSKATIASLTSALANGVMPVQNGAGGAVLVSAVTSYTQDSLGNLNYAVRDWAVVTVMDYAADAIQAMWAANFVGTVCANDPPKGQQLPNENVVTPSAVKAKINQVLTTMSQNGLVPTAQLTAMQALTVVILDSVTSGRFDAQVNVVPIQVTHQLAVNLNQVSLQ